MKTNLFSEVKKVVLYYSELKNKANMGFPITLKDIENRPINQKVKKIIKNVR